ncbi:MAG TPA: hypothetical protein VIU39_10585 [Anaerolineales bacterium]|jgi:hypothetical protein
MRKGTLFLSAAITAFILSILVGVASGYQRGVQKVEAAAPAAPAAQQAQPVSEAVAAAPAPAFTPQQAAALASQVLGRTDLYSVETADFNGQSAFMVTFSSGDVMYVSMDGQVLSITHITPTVITAPASQRRSGGSGSGSSAPHSSENEPHEEHETEHENH